MKGNTTKQTNGFLYVSNPPEVNELSIYITNGDYSENKTEGDGGIYVTNVGVNTSLEINNAIISHNEAIRGSAIYMAVEETDTISIRNTIFESN